MDKQMRKEVEHEPKRRKMLNENDVSYMVQRAVRDSLKTLTDEELSVIVDPLTQMTCMERLTADKKTWVESNRKTPTFGWKYYDMIMASYVSTGQR
eukprot:6382156-Amphidinium_carterae.1